MKTFFSRCLTDEKPQQNAFDTLENIKPQPIKFKFLNTVNLMDCILKKFALPRKKQKYLFPRDDLYFVENQKCQIPILYFPSNYPEYSLIMIYCHGSGSTLNNIYDFGHEMAVKYNIAFVAYDYTGDGQSEKQFSSFDEDIKLVLLFIMKRGYNLNKTILCGFSLGSYSALCLQGIMPRILISPICGIISFFEEQAFRYEGQTFDNIEKALQLNVNSLIFHCSKELVHISHGKLLHRALNKAKNQSCTFCQISDENYEHKTAPSYLLSKQGWNYVYQFLNKINKQSKKHSQLNQSTKKLIQQLKNLQYNERNQELSKQKDQITS